MREECRNVPVSARWDYESRWVHGPAPHTKSHTMFYVYILKSKKDNQLYIGYTQNIERRFQEHNSGNNESTRNRRPLILLYYEYHLNKQDALRRESYFKTTKGKSTLKQMIRFSLVEQNFAEDAGTLL